MHRCVLGLLVVAVSASASAEAINGVWKTQSNDKGGYLAVTIGPCAANAAKTGGRITAAYSGDGIDPDYENLGKVMIKDMASKDGMSFTGGTIWDPEKARTFRSKITMNGDELDVEGCVSFVCRGQDWTRVMTISRSKSDESPAQS